MDIHEPVVQVRLLMLDLKKSPRRQTTMPFGEEKDQRLLGVVLERIQNSYGQRAVIQASQIEHSREQLVLKAWRDAYGWK